MVQNSLIMDVLYLNILAEDVYILVKLDRVI
ncbi:hypothetical protein UJ101_00711 [Flavobacteriaceae bacterium UJ101]|nr:hypothetical protein UJ101_00711 [Flavobacteriaceae bacterium UJ101]